MGPARLQPAVKQFKLSMLDYRTNPLKYIWAYAARRPWLAFENLWGRLPAIMRPMILACVALAGAWFDTVGNDEWVTTYVSGSSLTAKPGATGGSKEVLLLPVWRDVRAMDLGWTMNAESDHYANVFQTSDSTAAVRVELVHPGELHLAVTDAHYLLIAENLDLSKPVRVDVKLEKTGLIAVSVDGIVRRRWVEPEWTARVATESLVLGTGFARQRNFVGEITDFHATVSHLRPRPIYVEVLSFFLRLLAVVAGTLLATARVRPTSLGIESEASQPLAWLGAAFLLGLLGWVAYRQGLPPGKWWLLICFVPLFFLRLTRFRVWPRASRLPLAFAAVGAVVVMIVLQFRRLEGFVVPTLWCALGFSVALARILRGSPAQYLGLGLMYGLAWCALATTLGPAVVFAKWQEFPTLSALIVAGLLIPLIMRALYSTSSDEKAPPFFRRLAPFLIFAFIASRTDSLRIPGAEMHWEYFVGPIRTLRNGGWLLWDVPSQYGFLNILLAHLMPLSSAWDSFYLTQSLVLIAAASIMYLVLRRSLPLGRSAAAAVVVSAFFFADPSLVGPSAYPSSSGMRFIWTYVFLGAAAYLVTKPRMNPRVVLLLGAPFWVFSTLWSGESAVYASLIYLGSAAYYWLIGQIDPERFAEIAPPNRSILIVVAGASAVVLILYGWYEISLGAMPDVKMHWMYATSYAGGFGEQAVDPLGPWLLIPPVLAIAAGILAREGQADGSAPWAPTIAAAAYVAALSYYIGRAVPNNFTALLPLVITVVAVLSGSLNRWVMAGVYAKALLVPMIALTVASGLVGARASSSYWPAFEFTSIESNLRPSGSELDRLLQRTGVTTQSKVVYYGYATTMPKKSSTEKSQAYSMVWLPTPLQLLEEPIPPSVQERILERFIQRDGSGGFIVHKKGEWDDRFFRLRGILSRNYREAALEETPEWEVIKYERR